MKYYIYITYQNGTTIIQPEETLDNARKTMKVLGSGRFVIAGTKTGLTAYLFPLGIMYMRLIEEEE